MSKSKKLILFVHCVLTLVLIAPLLFGLYSTALFGSFYPEAQRTAAFALFTMALVLNFTVPLVFERDFRTFLGDE